MKFFVISDVHSYYNEMITALNEAGFDFNNENHWLIGCGDYFDRGRQSQEVLDFLLSLPRKVLVKGNHEDLLEDLFERGYGLSHDKHNGTLQTAFDLGFEEGKHNFLVDMLRRAKDKFHLVHGQMVNFFETKNYIFVHSWIPLTTRIRKIEDKTNVVECILEDWRKATNKKWQEARWGNPFELAELGLLPDKTVVFGHWHTSWPRAKWYGQPETGENADFSIFYGNGYIGLDAMTAHSHKVNVLVIEDEFI